MLKAESRKRCKTCLPASLKCLKIEQIHSPDPEGLRSDSSFSTVPYVRNVHCDKDYVLYEYHSHYACTGSDAAYVDVENQ
jgi:hypothetical protein